MSQEDTLKTFRTAICEEFGLLGDEYLLGGDKHRGIKSLSFIIFCKLVKYHFNGKSEEIIKPYCTYKYYHRTEEPFIVQKLTNYEMTEEENNRYIKVARNVNTMMSDDFMEEYLKKNKLNGTNYFGEQMHPS